MVLLGLLMAQGTAFAESKLLSLILGALLFFYPLLPAIPGTSTAETTSTDTKVITAAVLNDFPPLYTRNQTGQPAGFAIDILERVAKETGLSISYLPLENWAQAMQAVRSGEADLIPAIGVTPQRRAEFLFSVEMETVPVSVFVRASNQSIQGIESLPGHRVAVIGESAAETRLKPMQDIELVPFTNINSALFRLMAGELDAFVFPEPVVKRKMFLMNIGDDHIKVVGSPLMELKWSFLARKTDQRLVSRLNPAIAAYTASDQYLADYKKWHGQPKSYWTVKRILITMTLLLAVTFVSLMVWRYRSVAKLNRSLNLSISEHSKANQRLAADAEVLRENEAALRRYQQVIAATPSHIAVVGRDYVYRLVNEAYLEAHQRSREEIIGYSVAELLGVDTFERVVRPKLDKCLAGETIEYRAEFDFPFSGRRYMDVTYFPYFDEDGSIKGVVVNSRDVTDLARAEEERERILENAHDLICIADMDGYFKYLSPAWEKTLGYSKEELMARPIVDFIYPEDHEKNMAERKRLIAGMETIKYENRYLHKDGSIHTISWKAKSVPKEKLIYGFGRDITDRKQVEDELRLARKFLETALAQSPAGIVIADAPDVTIRLANNAAFGIRGGAKNLLTGIDVQQHSARWKLCRANGSPYPPEQLPLSRAVLQGEVTPNEEMIIRDEEGNDHWVNANAAPIRNDEGEVTAGIVVFLDITEHKQAEKEMSRKLLDQEIMASILGLAMQPISLEEMLRQSLFMVLQRHGFGLLSKGSVFLVDENKNELVMKVQQGLPEAIKESCGRVPFGQCLCGTAAEEGRVVFVDKIDHQHEITYDGIEPHGHYCVPIQSAGQLLGVLNLYVSEEHPRTQDEEQFINAIADTMAGVIQRKQAEDKLKQAATVFEHATEGIIVTDIKSNIITINRAITEITGYSAEEAIGKNPSIWESDRHDPSFFQAMWASIEQTGQWRGEVWNRRKNGEAFPCWQTIRAVEGDSGEITHYVSILTDITAIKESQAKVEYLAHHDPLTDLPNRVLFNARLEHALNRSQRDKKRIGVLFLDLDRFKHINDSLGHPAGDRLLQLAAERLKAQVREEDTGARLGGDEFTIILEQLSSPKEAGIVASKILKSFHEPFELEDHTLHITASIGISLYPEDGTDVTTLIRNADAAMYRAKESGRNNYQFYHKEFTTTAEERMRLEASLRLALEREEFILYYQPQYSLETGQLIGAEALVRWQQPEQDLISPAKFIPLAEETGLILPLGEWVLTTACAQMTEWQARGVNLQQMSVNISGKQLQSKEFLSMFQRVISKTGCRADWLELEVTEGFIMQQAEQSVNLLEDLRAMGVKLAIDDFGTGYSSLSYLKHLPFTKLKIDQSFVRDIPQDADDMAIAKAVIALGRSLRLKVIAEGVETEQQASFLISEGCDEVQGYLYSRPVPAEEFAAFLEDQ